MSKIIFSVAVAFAVVLLTICAILYSIGASDINKSVYFNTLEKIRSAYNWALISLSLAWGTWFILVITLIFALVSGIFSIEKPTSISENDSDQAEKIADIYKRIRGGNSTQVIIIVFMFFGLLVNTLFAIFGVLAWNDLREVTPKDEYLKSAETYMMVGWIMAFAGWLFLLGAAISYTVLWSKVKKYLTCIGNACKKLAVPADSKTTYNGVSVDYDTDDDDDDDDDDTYNGGLTIASNTSVDPKTRAAARNSSPRNSVQSSRDSSQSSRGSSQNSRGSSQSSRGSSQSSRGSSQSSRGPARLSVMDSDLG